jgi:ribosomal protein L24E
MSQARRALITVISVAAVVLGFAPAAFAQSRAMTVTRTPSRASTSSVHTQTADPGAGYWLATQNGGVLSAGGASTHGSAIGVTLAHPIVGIASTPTRTGYWLVASDGGIFSYGDAAFHGSTGAMTLNKPIVGMAATPTGHGYWMVASDGGIFAFGDAHFYGSTGNITLNKPIVGITSTPSGHGYWMVASDGGIFAFGDAAFHGSTGNIALNMPVTGIAATPTGHGYWMVASDGGVFSFGDAGFHGSTGNITLNQPIVGMASTPTGHGYWFVAADGGVFSFGDAHFFGSGTEGATAPVVGMAPSAIAPATKLAFTTEPGGAAAGSPLSTQPVVTVENAGNGAAITDTSDVTLAVTDPAGATFGCTTNPETAVAGVATFAGCDIHTAGTYTLTATDGTLTSAVSMTVTITPPAARIVFTTEPSATATGGTAFVRQPAVTVQDTLGHTVTTDTSAVALTLTTPAGATLTCNPHSNAKAAVGGVATFTGCNIDRNSGTAYTLTATDGSLTGATSTGTVVSVGAAARLGFVQQPSTSTASTLAFAVQPHVAVQDAGGNTVTGNTSTVNLTLTTPGTATLACTSTTAVAAVAGVATYVGCHVDVAHSYTLHAADGALAAGTSATLAITVGTAAKLGFVQQPSTSTASTVAFAVQPRVAVQDAGGNTVTGNTTNVVLTLTTASGAALACTSTTTVAAVAGVATFVGCNINLVNSYTLHAADSALTIATSGPVAITAGAATHMVFTTQPVGAASGVTFATEPIVTVEDASGNTVTANVTPITLSITTPAGAVLACTTNPVTPTVGVATYAACHITGTANTYTLTANNGVLPNQASGNVIIT